MAWSTPGCTAVPLTTVHHSSEPQTALACAVMGSRFGRSCTTVWPAFVKRSRCSARLPDTFKPSFRSSSRSLRTLITGKFACLCSPVSIYTGQGKAGSYQNFAREAALSMGRETRFSSRESFAVWPKRTQRVLDAPPVRFQFRRTLLVNFFLRKTTYSDNPNLRKFCVPGQPFLASQLLLERFPAAHQAKKCDKHLLHLPQLRCFSRIRARPDCVPRIK